MRIAIIGAAELGRLIAKHIENDSTNEIVGFYDDFKKMPYF
jgi:FlaA1/EpsC-like NDP-sugar epimerase